MGFLGKNINFALVVLILMVVLVATGMHRPSSEEEIVRLAGPEVARDYRVVDHDSRRRGDMVEVGKIGGRVPALVNRAYVEADLKILTGFIEPHMWAGYSGGRKSILPGICSIETLQYMHGPEMVSHPGCEYGLLEGNPFHEAGLEVMAMAGADFIGLAGLQIISIPEPATYAALMGGAVLLGAMVWRRRQQ